MAFGRTGVFPAVSAVSASVEVEVLAEWRFQVLRVDLAPRFRDTVGEPRVSVVVAVPEPRRERFGVIPAWSRMSASLTAIAFWLREPRIRSTCFRYVLVFAAVRVVPLPLWGPACLTGVKAWIHDFFTLRNSAPLRRPRARLPPEPPRASFALSP